MRKFLFLIVALLWPAIVHAQASFELGNVVTMRDVSAGGNYEGTWTRRGSSDVYDAEWTFVPTGEKIVDVLEVRGVSGGMLTIYRRGNGGTYSAPVYKGVVGAGTASWVADPKYYWEVVSRTGLSDRLAPAKHTVRCYAVLGMAFFSSAPEAEEGETDWDLIARATTEDELVGEYLRLLKEAHLRLEERLLKMGEGMNEADNEILLTEHKAELDQWADLFNGAQTDADADVVLDTLDRALEPCLSLSGALG